MDYKKPEDIYRKYAKDMEDEWEDDFGDEDNRSVEEIVKEKAAQAMSRNNPASVKPEQVGASVERHSRMNTSGVNPSRTQGKASTPRPQKKPVRREAPVERKYQAQSQEVSEENLDPRARLRERKKRERELRAKKVKCYLVLLIEVAIILVEGIIFLFVRSSINEDKTTKTNVTTNKKSTDGKELASEDGENPLGDLIATPQDALEKDKVADIDFKPHAVESTQPNKLISYTAIVQNDQTVDTASFSDAIEMGQGDVYAQEPGIYTFRGNNFRDNPTYGTAEMKENKFEEMWNVTTGGGSFNGEYWSGSGWTGQPLMRKWTKAEKAHMNMYDWAKEDDNLVEVIYACMDGNIYFIDLNSGKETRDRMSLGLVFKGAGALDPRGLPIMYLGAGYNSDNQRAHAFIINLIDCSVMYEFGNADPMSLRGELSFFDSSALVDAETDTMIYPGENGILYLMKLNTKYDETAGTLTINPETTRWNYNGVRSGSQYWLGMEDSCCIYKGYLFVADNGGNLMCMDLKTLKLVWVQDVLDDTNGSPVLSIEDGKLYLYISTSFHYGWRSYDVATIPVWKINAETGEVVWHTDYECSTIEDVSGGVQSTMAVGKHELKDYVYVTVSRTGGMGSGVLACLNKKDGSKAWEVADTYTWSSPVCVYNSDGTGQVIYANCNGYIYIMDGKTGKELDKFAISDGTIEASPAVFEDKLVIGTRSGKIWGLKLK